MLNGSWSIARFANIPVRLHWSFAFVFVVIAFFSVSYELQPKQIFAFTLYILTLYLCVVFHEYGHALMAKRFGVDTEDIIISPIGGVARLHRIPHQPFQEFLIAIAGPVVNVVLALIIATILLTIGERVLPASLDSFSIEKPIEFLRMVLVLNVILFLFNLIPAFPMDGGRILRALLASKIPYVKATTIASLIGRIIAIGFFIYGIYSKQYTLPFIAILIFTMARNEERMVKRTYKHE